MKRKRILYEAEDDVLNIWLSDKHFDYAEDEGGVIIHYTKNKEPVYIEILDASRFLNRQKVWSQRSASAVAQVIRVKRK